MLKVRFNYDEKGQRMEKINYTSGIHTWYISDAGGKTVRIYEKKMIIRHWVQVLMGL